MLVRHRGVPLLLILFVVTLLLIIVVNRTACTSSSVWALGALGAGLLRSDKHTAAMVKNYGASKSMKLQQCDTVAPILCSDFAKWALGGAET